MEQAPYQQQWLDRGGDRLGLQVYDDPGGPLVMIWPAMGVPARFYRPFATALQRAGLAVAVADLRGTGASTPRPSRRSRYGYATLVDDVGAVLAAHRNGRPLVLLGHSLGGQACLLHLAGSGGDGVAGLALVAVGLPYWRCYRDWRRYGVVPYAQTIHATATVLGVWPGWGFGGRQARGVIRDWAYTARTGRFPRLGGVDREPAVASLRTPVLAVSLEHDQFTPAPTVDHLVGKLAAAPVQRTHHGGGADHFSWARSVGGPVVDRVAAFAAAARGPTYARRSGRVLLLDGAGRVLLLRCYLNEGRGATGWFTPGGGVGEGEEPRMAAVRELREEVGLALAPGDLGPQVAQTSGYAELGWANGWFRDDYFLHRVGTHRVDLSGLEPHERAVVVEARWWSAAELADTTEVVFPLELAPLVADLAAGRIPPEPVHLPWHH